MVVPVSGIRHAVAIDFDPVDKFLYWSDDEKLEIKRCRMNGQSKFVVISHVNLFGDILYSFCTLIAGSERFMNAYNVNRTSFTFT